VIPRHLHLTEKPHLNLTAAVELLLPPFQFGEEWTYLAVR
jgi:hypothetical protein